ncbi:hypothetical protein AAF712_007833 [Marasmius tenuissimus]|uniref:Uncharacterized protein n=1 Tax=Marasmius tenuissimus TaxID=585030 RepID=A0ABR2ZWJ7_9AGAR
MGGKMGGEMAVEIAVSFCYLEGSQWQDRRHRRCAFICQKHSPGYKRNESTPKVDEYLEDIMTYGKEREKQTLPDPNVDHPEINWGLCDRYYGAGVPPGWLFRSHRIPYTTCTISRRLDTIRPSWLPSYSPYTDKSFATQS